MSYIHSSTLYDPRSGAAGLRVRYRSVVGPASRSSLENCCFEEDDQRSGTEQMTSQCHCAWPPLFPRLSGSLRGLLVSLRIHRSLTPFCPRQHNSWPTQNFGPPSSSVLSFSTVKPPKSKRKIFTGHPSCPPEHGYPWFQT